MAAYYNELDKFAAQWLRELIKAGLIADGEVDERDIRDVRADDLRDFTQCHFFAGIGGWSYALRLAGWPDDRPVWTGSCPCQPYSVAGSGGGADDARNLWPAWFRLIRELKPQRIFGEQVASAIGHGWLDHVSTDMEAEGYAIGATVLGAHSIGAPHLRQRLWFIADANRERLPGSRQALSASSSRPTTADWASITSSLGDDSFGTRLAGSAGSREPMLYTGADGLSAFMGRVRGYGNAIVPQVAAAFIQCSVEAIKELNP